MAWLNGFSNRLKLTIPIENVDSNLTDFPVMIYLSTDSGLNNYDVSAVFDELDNDHQKYIAVTTSNGTTQCPVEIEYWDSTEEKAILWTKIPTVYSTVDTDMYLYFDATYGGTTTSGNVDYIGNMNDTIYQMIINIGDEGTYDTTHAYFPCVIKESDTSYKMWYSGYVSNHRILYATSIDGISWTGHQMVVNINNISYDSAHAHAPCVIKESPTSYKMWYAGENGVNYRILYTTSTDGISWTGHQMVVDINQETTYDTNYVTTPCVIKDDSTYKMWYSGHDGANYRTMYALSDNGTTWSGHTMVVNIGAEGTHDTSHILAPYVIKESDTSYKMWYTGHGGAYWKGLSATSTNGTTWGNFELVLDVNCQRIYDTDGNGLGMCVINDDGVYRMWHAGGDGTNYRVMYSIYWKNPSQDVWDDDFEVVYHMAQDPSGGSGAIKDSTSNTNHGTPDASMTLTDLVDGKIGKAIDFDGTDDDVVISTVTIGANTTFSFIADADSGATQQIISGVNASNRMALTSTQLKIQSAGLLDVAHGTTISNWHMYTIVMPTLADYYVYVDGELAGSANDPTATAVDVHNIGGKDFSTAWSYYNGRLDEIRLSSDDRSAAWIKADYYNNWDNFIVFQEDGITTNWLTDWSKRIKLTIDHTKVDNVLLDFPVAFTLDTTSSGVFDELYNTLDDFNDHGVTLPTANWSQYADQRGTLYNGKLRFTLGTGGVDDAQGSTSIWTMSGDFDIESKFAWVDPYDVNNNETSISVQMSPSGYRFRMMNRYAGGRYYYRDYYDGSWQAGVTTATTDLNGRLRIQRVGTTLYPYYWNDAGWVLLGTGISLNAEDATVRMVGRNQTGYPPAVVEVWDLNCDWGSGSKNYRLDANRKKIAVTTEDGTTQCPVEIEYWDGYTKEAVIWTKVPTVSSDQDTILYLYYDSSKDDNDAYVGDTDDAAAQAVWSNDFVAVYHMSQYPSGGSNCIRNSVSSSNRGTPAGTMIPTNLVDGKIGKALDFDGIDDSISCGTLLASATALTFEVVCSVEANAAYKMATCLYYNAQNRVRVGSTPTETEFINSEVLNDSIACSNSNDISSGYHFLCMVRTGSLLKGYVNSSEVCSKACSHDNSDMTGSPTFYIGSESTSVYPWYGTISEVRASSIDRSAAWIKATYYSNWNTLVTYGDEQPRPIFLFYGTVQVEGNPAARMVCLYRRSTGEFMGSTVSSSVDGYFEIGSYYNDYHYVVVLPELAETYNLLSYDKIHPGV